MSISHLDNHPIMPSSMPWVWPMTCGDDWDWDTANDANQSPTECSLRPKKVASWKKLGQDPCHVPKPEQIFNSLIKYSVQQLYENVGTSDVHAFDFSDVVKSDKTVSKNVWCKFWRCEALCLCGDALSRCASKSGWKMLKTWVWWLHITSLWLVERQQFHLKFNRSDLEGLFWS